MLSRSTLNSHHVPLDALHEELERGAVLVRVIPEELHVMLEPRRLRVQVA
jgi:hypothetical protein